MMPWINLNKNTLVYKIMTELTDEQKKELIEAYIEFENQIETKRRHVHELLAKAMQQLDQIKIDSLLKDIKDNNL